MNIPNQSKSNISLYGPRIPTNTPSVDKLDRYALNKLHITPKKEKKLICMFYLKHFINITFPANICLCLLVLLLEGRAKSDLRLQYCKK